MKNNIRQQVEVGRYTQAIISLKHGDRQPAIDAIQMGELPDDQLMHGCVERLHSAYAYFRGFGPRHRAPKELLMAAYLTLKSANLGKPLFEP